MIKIHLTQLNSRLAAAKKQATPINCFLLIGSEPYLQHEAQKQLESIIETQGTIQHLAFTINNSTDWDSIFKSCQSLNLFANKTVLLLQCGDTTLSTPLSHKLHALTSQLHDDTILIISMNKFTHVQENSEWLTAISRSTIWINCQPLDKQYLPIWLSQQTKQRGITLDKPVAELLCYYYEGNLLALSQLLDHLKIVYPNKKILLNQIEESINDSAIFSPYHWLDAILDGKIKRTIHILQQLKHKESEPLILLRTLQKELILLISLKKASYDNALQYVFNQYKVWQSRRRLFSEILNRLDLKQFYDALHDLTDIELHLKRDYNLATWQTLEKLSLKLVGKTISKDYQLS